MKFTFKNDNDGDMCIITMNPRTIIVRGKFLPKKGRIPKIEELINDMEQQDFEKNIVVDIEDFALADSTGIMKMKKIFRAMLKNTREVTLLTQKNNRFHEVTMKTVIESIPNIEKVIIC